MALNYHLATLFILLLTTSGLQKSYSALVTNQPLVLKYHNGALLKGPLNINLVWYGKFTPTQRSIIVDFLQSLNTVKGLKKASTPLPSVSSWWKTTEKYHNGSSAVVVGKQILDQTYSLGKFLKNYHIQYLATKVAQKNSINVVLTAKEVGVDGFCMSRCGTHGSTKTNPRVAYAWVGDSENQCPGQCAWPFHQPMYGPQTAPLVSPNGDVGVDGMVINLATVLAGAVTNPFNQGYFQGPATAPLEAVSACTGIFGSGAYPGYAGQVLVDKTTGASYNAHGLNGRKYLISCNSWCELCFVAVSSGVGPLLKFLWVAVCSGCIFGVQQLAVSRGILKVLQLFKKKKKKKKKNLIPAMWDPKTSTCTTLV